MEKYIVKVIAAEFITHNVRRFVVEKPFGYSFVPGQATDVSINKPGMEEELRPFTFTSLATAQHLEFMIKIYKGHDGVTEKLGLLQVGEELIIHEVFGTIRYYDTGIFIAGGAGITPFVAILRSLQQQQGSLKNLTLLFANHSEKDIILKDELAMLLGSHFINVLSEPISGGQKQVINAELISANKDAKTNYYYICGPDQFVADMVAILYGLGATEEQIIIEK